MAYDGEVREDEWCPNHSCYVWQCPPTDPPHSARAVPWGHPQPLAAAGALHAARGARGGVPVTRRVLLSKRPRAGDNRRMTTSNRPMRPGENIDLDTAVLVRMKELTGDPDWLESDHGKDTVADILDVLHDDRDCWVPVFVAWAEGQTETLDFGGREVPERVQRLLTALQPAGHVLALTRTGWWLQHPLPCRPNLADCPLNLQAESLARSLVDIHGEQAYRKWDVGLDEDGRVNCVNASREG